MVKAIVIGVGALVIIGGVGYVVTQNNKDDSGSTNQQATQTTEEPQVQATEEKPTNDQAGGTYEEYAEAKLAKASNGNVVLFFNAVWCPDCRATVQDLEANRDDIPKNLTILNVDYDSNGDLKKKYGVTYQHTFVQVDENGNQIKKWGGSFTLDDIVAQVE